MIRIIFMLLLFVSCTNYNNELNGVYRIIVLDIGGLSSDTTEKSKMMEYSERTYVDYVEIKLDSMRISSRYNNCLSMGDWSFVDFIEKEGKFIDNNRDTDGDGKDNFEFGENGYYSLKGDSLFRYTEPIGEEDIFNPLWVAVRSEMPNLDKCK